MGQERANPLANADNDNTSQRERGPGPHDPDLYRRIPAGSGPEAGWKDVRLDFSLASQTLTVRAVAEGPAPVDTAWFTLLAPDFDFQAGAADPFTATPSSASPTDPSPRPSSWSRYWMGITWPSYTACPEARN